MSFEVVESVLIHESIKFGKPDRDRIENNCENIRRLSKVGVFDWLRSDLSHPLPNGSNALAYDNQIVLFLDPATSELSLPGWDESYSKEDLK